MFPILQKEEQDQFVYRVEVAEITFKVNTAEMYLDFLTAHAICINDDSFFHSSVGL